MPIYAYRCESCGHQKDALQKLSDAPLTQCPACGEPALRKQLTAAGFQLKGSGWYATDFKQQPAAKPAGGAAGAPAAADGAASGGAAATPSGDAAGGAANGAKAGTAAATSAAPAAAAATGGCAPSCGCH